MYIFHSIPAGTAVYVFECNIVLLGNTIYFNL